MSSPWTPPTPQRQPIDRPWMGVALLLSVPLLSLILIRMLWSGSTIWFLIAGILMLGGAAAVFFSRRDTPSYGYETLSPEPNRLPLWLLGLGVLFLGMLIVPTMSSGSSPAGQSGSLAQKSGEQSTVQPTVVPRQTSRLQPTARPATAALAANPPASQDEATPSQSSNQVSNSSPPAGSQTYVVRDGDTLWGIAQQFGVTVDDIVAANKLGNESDLQLGEQLIIPPSADAITNTGTGTDAGGQTASEPEATPSE